MQSGAGELTPSGWYVQGQQTLTPRLFAAGRVERIGGAGAVSGVGTVLIRQHLTGIEEVLGFRLTPELTVRIGHRARETFGRQQPAPRRRSVAGLVAAVVVGTFEAFGTFGYAAPGRRPAARTSRCRRR